MMVMDVDVCGLERGVVVRAAGAASDMTRELMRSQPGFGDDLLRVMDMLGSGEASYGMVVPRHVSPDVVVCHVLVGEGYDDASGVMRDALLRVVGRYPGETVVVDGEAWDLMSWRDALGLMDGPFVVDRDVGERVASLPDADVVACGGGHVTSDMRDRTLTFSPRRGASGFDPACINPVRNDELGGVKPRGGGWLSVDGGWERWCLSEEPEWLFGGTSEVRLAEGTRILRIDSLQDVSGLPKMPRVMGCMNVVRLDFEALSKDYDGVFVNVHGDESGELYEAFYTWDCPSLVLFDPACVEHVGELRETDVTAEAHEEMVRQAEWRTRLMGDVDDDLCPDVGDVREPPDVSGIREGDGGPGGRGVPNP